MTKSAKRIQTLALCHATAMAILGLALLPASARAAGCAGSPGCPYGDVSVLGQAPVAGHGVFRFPQAIAFSPGGSYVFVADQYSATVQKFDRQGQWQSQFGWYADRRQPGRFGVIGGLATDRNNHVYVLDSENDRVQVFRSDSGDWLGAWGSTGSGPGRFSLGANTGAGGLAIHQATAGDRPIAYVADQYNHRIEKFTLSQLASGDSLAPVLPAGSRDPAEPDSVPVPAPDAVWGTYGDCTPRACGDPADRYLLNYPQGVAVSPRPDGAGRNNVYVADDDNHRVVEFTPSGTYLREVGGYGSQPGQFRFPYDVGVDSHDYLYVADNNNHRVQKFSAADLGFLGTWGGFGPAPGELEYPRALSALADDPLGGAYVADTANNRVQGFDESGGPTAAWGIAGRGPGYVTRPWGLAVDGAGDVYVADTWSHRIEKLSPGGSYLAQWGYISARSGYAAPGTGNGQFQYPHGVAFDPKGGNLWVADTANNRVQELTPSGSWVSTVGGTAPGSGAGQFSAPHGVAVAPDGDVYVADTLNNRVQRRDAATGAWSSVATGSASLNEPAGVAVDGSDNLYVLDGNRLLKVAAGRATTIQPPSGTLSRPSGIWSYGTRLYVSDTRNNRVLRLDTQTGRWDSFGGEGLGLGSFLGPASLTTDAAGETLYVADQYNNRVQSFSLGGSSRAVAPAVASAAPATSPAPVSNSLPKSRRARARLSLHVRARRFLRKRAVIVSVLCTERCVVTGSGKLKVRGRHKAFRLRRARRSLRASVRARLRLRLSVKAHRSIRRALVRRRRVTARVAIRARDVLGNHRSAIRTIQIR